MEKRKQIAIFGWKTGENSFGVTVPYYEFLDNFGDVNIIPPVPEIDFSGYDLLVIPGGPDVNPVSYGHVPSMFTGKSDPIREYYDRFMIPDAIQQGIPIVGICRGHQSLAVHFGGVLRQHMYHKTNKVSDRTETVHDMNISLNALPEALGNALRNKLGSRKAKHGVMIYHQEVNSIHHQVVATVPEEAVVLGTHFDSKEYPKDKSIEALYYPKYNIASFQYHPEEIWDSLATGVIYYLLTVKEQEDGQDEGEAVGEDGKLGGISV